MNEAPFPTQTTVPRTLPPPSMRGAPAPRVSRLRATLVICSGEGAVAEIVGACFSSAFTSDLVFTATVWRAPTAGGPAVMVASGQESLTNFVTDARYVYWATARTGGASTIVRFPR